MLNQSSVRLLEPSERQSADTGQVGLLERCRAGDREALDQVLRKHLPAIERLLGRLRPGEDRHDLVQRSLIAAVRAFPSFKGDSAVSTWLLGIATNVAREHFRAERARRRLTLAVNELQAADASAPADAVVSSRMLLRRIEHHLASMSDKQRFAYVLHVLEGHPIDETARILGVPVMTAKSRVFLARRFLLARAANDRALIEMVEGWKQ